MYFYHSFWSPVSGAIQFKLQSMAFMEISHGVEQPKISYQYSLLPLQNKSHPDWKLSWSRSLWVSLRMIGCLPPPGPQLNQFNITCLPSLNSPSIYNQTAKTQRLDILKKCSLKCFESFQLKRVAYRKVTKPPSSHPTHRLTSCVCSNWSMLLFIKFCINHTSGRTEMNKSFTYPLRHPKGLITQHDHPPPRA